MFFLVVSPAEGRCLFGCHLDHFLATAVAFLVDSAEDVSKLVIDQVRWVHKVFNDYEHASKLILLGHLEELLFSILLDVLH